MPQELDKQETENKEVNQQSGKVAEEAGKKEYQEITLKFGKGCLEDQFTGKDGTLYQKILVPNPDPADKSPWKTFIAKANQVHENQFGKGVWLKLPSEGHTTLHKSVAIENPDGTKKWGTEKTTVTNKELKQMMEAYKERNRGSIKDKIEDKKMEAATHNTVTQKTDRPLKLSQEIG